VTAVTERYQTRLRLLQSKPSENPDEVVQLFEITVDGKLKDRMIRFLKDWPDTQELVIANSSPWRLMGLIRAKGPVSRCIADSDCFLLYASNNLDSTMVWRVLGAERSFERLQTRFEGRGIEYKIRDRSVVSSRRRLTGTQEWILRLAFQKGYFDTPKKIHIRSLAKSAGMSPPAFHESLRKAQKKILEEHIRNIRVVDP
jgi:predicted DNA binding protein